MTTAGIATPFQRDDVHVWAVDTGRTIDAALLATYATWLTSDETRRWRRFHFARDRHRFLVTRALIRERLSYYCASIEPAQWRFVCNEYGRPDLTPELRAECSCRFNLSHTTDAVVLAVSRDGEVGVDVEYRRPLSDLEAIARQHFAEAETSALLGLPEAQREQRFFELWTLKEAYIKARGMGLAIPLDAFGFCFDRHAGVDFFATDDSGDSAQGWHFAHGPFGDRHQLAVALRQSGLHWAPRVGVRTMVPALTSAAAEHLPRLQLGRHAT